MGQGRGISLGTVNLVMVIFLGTVHFVLAAVGLVILTTKTIQFGSPFKGGRGWVVLNLFWILHSLHFLFGGTQSYEFSS